MPTRQLELRVVSNAQPSIQGMSCDTVLAGASAHPVPFLQNQCFALEDPGAFAGVLVSGPHQLLTNLSA